MLWFAWKLVLLQYRKQTPILPIICNASCDLLENSYFCSIANNGKSRLPLTYSVVICLKTRTFAVSQTTSTSSSLLLYWLWFAWKLVLLQYRKQQLNWQWNRASVVICLKTRTFAVSQTTACLIVIGGVVLWFAWKLVLLQYRKQLTCFDCKAFICCDLLENSYFCSIANNLIVMVVAFHFVVICLKTRTFAVSQTTGGLDVHYEVVLWFAWKLVLLQYRKQQAAIQALEQIGCDLLENSYFCSIANNKSTTFHNAVQVVICLKTRTFAVSQTTPTDWLVGISWLWFAWKLVLLQYRKQP